eukprot:jgi/Mesen1/2663/ME000167S01809
MTVAIDPVSQISHRSTLKAASKHWGAYERKLTVGERNSFDKEEVRHKCVGEEAIVDRTEGSANNQVRQRNLTFGGPLSGKQKVITMRTGSSSAKNQSVSLSLKRDLTKVAKEGGDARKSRKRARDAEEVQVFSMRHSAAAGTLSQNEADARREGQGPSSQALSADLQGLEEQPAVVLGKGPRSKRATFCHSPLPLPSDCMPSGELDVEAASRELPASLNADVHSYHHVSDLLAGRLTPEHCPPPPSPPPSHAAPARYSPPPEFLSEDSAHISHLIAKYSQPAVDQALWSPRVSGSQWRQEGLYNPPTSSYAYAAPPAPPAPVSANEYLGAGSFWEAPDSRGVPKASSYLRGHVKPSYSLLEYELRSGSAGPNRDTCRGHEQGSLSKPMWPGLEPGAGAEEFWQQGPLLPPPPSPPGVLRLEGACSGPLLPFGDRGRRLESLLDMAELSSAMDTPSCKSGADDIDDWLVNDSQMEWLEGASDWLQAAGLPLLLEKSEADVDAAERSFPRVSTSESTTANDGSVSAATVTNEDVASAGVRALGGGAVPKGKDEEEVHTREGRARDGREEGQEEEEAVFSHLKPFFRNFSLDWLPGSEDSTGGLKQQALPLPHEDGMKLKLFEAGVITLPKQVEDVGESTDC